MMMITHIAVLIYMPLNVNGKRMSGKKHIPLIRTIFQVYKFYDAKKVLLVFCLVLFEPL